MLDDAACSSWPTIVSASSMASSPSSLASRGYIARNCLRMASAIPGSRRIAAATNALLSRSSAASNPSLRKILVLRAGLDNHTIAGRGAASSRAPEGQ